LQVVGKMSVIDQQLKLVVLKLLRLRNKAENNLIKSVNPQNEQNQNLIISFAYRRHLFKATTEIIVWLFDDQK
jgi:hypothetical protein